MLQKPVLLRVMCDGATATFANSQAGVGDQHSLEREAQELRKERRLYTEESAKIS